MSTLQIIEAQGVGKQASSDLQGMLLPFITVQNVTFTGSAGYSAATNSNTGLVRLFASAQCAVLPSTTSSASVGSSTGIILAANTPEYFPVQKGTPIYFSVISNS